MSTDEKNDIKGLLSDLLAKAKGLNELDLVLLRDEIRKEIEAGDKTLERFLELVESFQEVLPKEKQRYSVAIRALFTTSKISRQNVFESIDKQLEELGKLESSASSGLTGFSDELNEMESRLQETKSELTDLREKIAALEKVEQKILDNISDREKEKNAVEEAVKTVFADITAEISAVKKKIEEYTAEKGSPKPIAEPDPIESEKQEDNVEEGGVKEKEWGVEEIKIGTGEEEGGAEEEDKVGELPPIQSKFVKKCPMCGGQINFLIEEATWMCYTCGHEEAEKAEA